MTGLIRCPTGLSRVRPVAQDPALRSFVKWRINLVIESITWVQVDFENRTDGIRIECQVTTAAQTGVEMEALTRCHYRRTDDL
jgi:MoaC family